MSRYPTSGRKDLLEQKKVVAEMLLKRGLTTTQVAGQTNTSRAWVRGVQKALQAATPDSSVA